MIMKRDKLIQTRDELQNLIIVILTTLFIVTLNNSKKFKSSLRKIKRRKKELNPEILEK